MTLEKRKERNFNAILKAVGNNGNCYVQPPRELNCIQTMLYIQELFHPLKSVFPTLNDLKITYPKIYEKYSKYADGEKIVLFKPMYINSDEWGMIFHNVYGAYKDEEKTVVIFERNESYSSLLFKKEEIVEWTGLRHETDLLDNFKNCENGKHFTFDNTNFYKLNIEEIIAIISNKIFEV